MVKPAVSVGAIGASRVSHRDDAAGWAPEPHLGDLLVQPLMAGVAEGETSMIAIDGRVTARGAEDPRGGRVPGPRRSTAGARSSTRRSRPSSSWPLRRSTRWADSLLYARVDCVATEEGPRLMELELIEPSLFLLARSEVVAVDGARRRVA